MDLGRIVVGVDFSAPSIATARWAARHLARGAELVLAHVIVLPEPPPIVRSRYPRRELTIETLRQGADKRLRELSTSLAAERIWLEIREGTPAEALAQIAEEFNAALLVVGAHGERPGEWEGLGSTAEHLVSTASIPVMLVNGAPTGAPSRILVPVDESDVSADALHWAADLSERFTARVIALHVVTSGAMGHVLRAASIVSGTPPTDAGPRPVAAAEHDRWIDRAVGAGIPRERVTSEVTFGEPVAEITAAAERMGADVIVMGRRASGGLRRAVLGSVTKGVLRHAPCPVVVIGE